MKVQSSTGRRIRRITSAAIATTFMTQNFAWAVCSDGLGFPPGQTSYVSALLPPDLQNMQPHVFTGTGGGYFIPDNSVCENNSGTPNGLGANGLPLTGGAIGRPCIGQPNLIALHGSGLGGRNDPTITVPTTLPQIPVGGHDWVADQGSDTCKMQEVGPADQPATSWNIPPNTVTDCVVTPVVKIGPGGFPQLFNFMVAPLQFQPIVLPCDPTKLSTLQQFDPVTGLPIPGTGPNVNNTRINQLACAVSEVLFGQVTASDQTTAPVYSFVAGIQGGLFAQRLDNTNNTASGDAGRTISEFKYYGDIPTGQKLTNAMVSNDGHFAGATSIRRNPNVFVCNYPLGDPGRIDQPVPPIPTFIQTQDSTTPNLPQGVKCLTSVAQSGLAVTLANYWAPDNQPYLGGQRTVTTAGGIGSLPGGYFQANNWPQCIVFGKVPVTLPAVEPSENAQFGDFNKAAALDAAIKTVFQNHSNGGCGTFGANAGFAGTAVIQPQVLEGYVTQTGQIYMFTAGIAQPVVQAKLTRDAVGQTHYSIRTYLQNQTGFVTGLGIASAMNFTGTGSHDSQGNPTPNPLATGGGSLIVMTDPSGIGLAAQEIMTRLPLCEDF
jgi:hypothetical protein